MILHWPYRNAHIFNRFFLNKNGLNNSQRKLWWHTLLIYEIFIDFFFSSINFFSDVVVVSRNVLIFKQLAKTHSLDTLFLFLHTHRKKNISIFNFAQIPWKRKWRRGKKETFSEKENHIHTNTLRQWKSVWTLRK